MGQDKRIDIIKGALLLERRGISLYSSVARSSEKPGVIELFALLVREEESHIVLLSKQFRHLIKGEDVDMSGTEDSGPLHRMENGGDSVSAAETVITQKVVDEVSGAGYEAAIISAALEFEKNAVKYYQEKAAQAQAEGEKELFEWLTRWEINHLHMLSEIDSELKNKVWYDNSFWPLD